MRILHLIDTLEYGGSPSWLQRVTRALEARGHAQEVWCCNRADPAMVAGFPSTVPVRRLGLARYVSGLGLAALLQRLRRRDVDTLHTILPYADLLGRLAGALAGAPVVSSVQGRYTPWQMRLSRLTAPLSARSLVIAEALAAFTAEHGGVPRDRILVVPNGLDPAPFTLGDEAKAEGRRRLGGGETPVALCVARLGPEKDHATLLEAFARLETPARLALAGEGPCRTALEAQIERHGLGERVVLLGNRDDIPHLMYGADLFVLASRHEGMPNVLLEAMAARLPVVATAVGGVPEIVVHDETGVVVPPGDPAVLAQAMDALLRDPARRRAMAQAGRKRLEARFAFDATIDAMEQAFAHAASTNRRRGARDAR